jgi:hypothetical protein
MGLKSVLELAMFSLVLRLQSAIAVTLLNRKELGQTNEFHLVLLYVRYNIVAPSNCFKAPYRVNIFHVPILSSFLIYYRRVSQKVPRILGHYCLLHHEFVPPGERCFSFLRASFAVRRKRRDTSITDVTTSFP